MKLFKSNNDVSMDEKFTLEKCIEFIENKFNELVEDSVEDRGLKVSEYEKRKNIKNDLMKSLKNCSYGSVKDKKLIKGYIQDLLTQQYGINKNNIDLVLNFDNPTLRIKFEILLYMFYGEYGYWAFERILKKYELDKPKIVDGQMWYKITEKDIEDAFENENYRLSFYNKLDVVTQIIYSEIKGISVIDELRDNYINGLSAGVNGIPEMFIDQVSTYKRLDKGIKKAHQSIWVNFEGKNIYLEFLSFNSYKKLKDICQEIYKFNNPGQLSEDKGYIINSDIAGNRIVVFTTPFAETDCFFIRKFDLPSKELEYLIQGNDGEVVIDILKFMMKGEQKVFITGHQGTGKSTLLLAMIKYIYPIYTLRFLETTFELRSRCVYPDRNILTLQETNSIKGREAVSVLKKTDGQVLIAGEIAEDETAVQVVEVSESASRFTLSSHHAVTFKKLVSSLRNSLLKTGVFRHEKLAEEQIIAILDFDVHLNIDKKGNRFIERITECIDKGNGEYEANNIVEYDMDTRTYIIKNNINDERIKKMASEMIEEDKVKFLKLISDIDKKVKGN